MQLFHAVFPTPVGVFRDWNASTVYDLGLPHARGGVSPEWAGLGRFAGSSPRPWGCFRTSVFIFALGPVFPTPVGVFPGSRSSGFFQCSLPHARGGVSHAHPPHGGVGGSSPRPWGCFMYSPIGFDSNLVFPTPVGVFPPRWIFYWYSRGLPHARGGVSIELVANCDYSRSSPRPWGCFFKLSFLILF